MQYIYILIVVESLIRSIQSRLQSIKRQIRPYLAILIIVHIAPSRTSSSQNCHNKSLIRDKNHLLFLGLSEIDVWVFWNKLKKEPPGICQATLINLIIHHLYYNNSLRSSSGDFGESSPNGMSKTVFAPDCPD